MAVALFPAKYMFVFLSSVLLGKSLLYLCVGALSSAQAEKQLYRMLLEERMKLARGIGTAP